MSTSVNKCQQLREEEEEEKKKKREEVYKEGGHLSITLTEFNKLIDEGFTTAQADEIINKVLNYSKNHKYKSLYLTALSWLRRDKEREEVKEQKKKIVPVPHWNELDD